MPDNHEMTRSEMISFITGNPYKRVKHRLFSDEEYLYLANDGYVYEESDYLFETWDPSDWAHNGLRTRSGGVWETGWSLCATQPEV